MCLIVSFAVSCNKPTDYEKYLSNHEIIYPGTVKLKAVGGNYRVLMYWNPSPDKTIAKYMIYWNHNLDSISVNATTLDPDSVQQIYFDNLKETQEYDFTFYSLDSAGNKSIPIKLNPVRVYGNYYQKSLKNRIYSTYSYSNDTVTIQWNKPDTVNINTQIRFTNLSGQQTIFDLSPTSKSSVIAQYMPNTYIYYKSSYLPITNSPDTFYVSKYDSILIPQ